MSAARGADEHDTAPFLVHLFYRSGSFHRPEEFASPALPPHVSIYTWPTCTLNELALELAAAKPGALPTPAVGTRLSFQLVCPDLRGTSATNTTQPKFVVKEIGSIVIGEGYPGAENPDDAGPDILMRNDGGKDKTLADWRFVVGDYISCAVFPPRVDGSVVPLLTARKGSISGGRDGRSSNFRGGFQNRDNNFGRNNGRQGRTGWRDGRLPPGDWRRGEQLPDGPPGGPRGRERW
ncbi:Sin3 associated polypeptide p18 domain-containing protein [Trichoderma ceciliae]